MYDDLISETVQQAARDLVHTTICALVQSHMTISKSDDWLDDLICETIQPIIRLVVSSSGQKLDFTQEWDKCITQVEELMLLFNYLLPPSASAVSVSWHISIKVCSSKTLTSDYEQHDDVNPSHVKKTAVYTSQGL